MPARRRITGHGLNHQDTKDTRNGRARLPPSRRKRAGNGPKQAENGAKWGPKAAPGEGEAPAEPPLLSGFETLRRYLSRNRALRSRLSPEMLENAPAFERIARKGTGFSALCSKRDRAFCTLLENDPGVFEHARF